MTPWRLLAERPAMVLRTRDWNGALGESYLAWAPLLRQLSDPAGATFFADFGSGKAEYEVAPDDDGYVAVPLDGVTIYKINATEAEFQSLERLAVLRHVAARSRCEGDVVQLSAHLFRLGCRNVEGTNIMVFSSIGSHDGVTDAVLRASLGGGDVALLLVPNATDMMPGRAADLLARGVATIDLPLGEPWGLDWTPVVDALGIPVEDLGVLLGDRFKLVVDAGQQRIWIDGVKVPFKAGSQPYRLIAHLAGRANVFVTYEEVANKVLVDARGGRSEAKIFADVRDAFFNAVRTAFASRGGSTNLESLIQTSGGRARLAVSPNLVRVVRTPTEP